MTKQESSPVEQITIKRRGVGLRALNPERAFPGFTLAVLILSINLLGDWLRDALNPKLR